VTRGITEIAHITTKQDLSRWTRAHADEPGITWRVIAGPGGTMIIVEYAEDVRSMNRANVSPGPSGVPLPGGSKERSVPTPGEPQRAERLGVLVGGGRQHQDPAFGALDPAAEATLHYLGV
jgi:hypothetical protein